MAILPVLVAPDARLKVVSKPVEAVDAEVRRLMDDLLETMYDAPGVGLAAPQVGVAKRVIVVDVAREGEDPKPLRMANPQLVTTSDETAVWEEGCLSLPEQFADVRRPARCTVDYLDYDGAAQRLEAEGLLATCVQHEMDHLDGVLFVDHISKIKRDLILRRLAKQRRMRPEKARAPATHVL
jgi:peptide deformylase